MADIKNELSWSKSRVGMLKTCKRQYFHRYYGFWGGWSYDAPHESRLAYRFSKMQNLPTLCGIAVHRSIEFMLRDILEVGAVQTEDPAYHARKEILTRTWKEAEQELWKKSPKKHPPLFELYYGPKPTPEALKEIGKKSSRCVHNFLESSVFEAIRTSDPKQWLAIEAPLDADPYAPEKTTLKLDGKTLWCLPDFARRVDGGVELWDWKTGAPYPGDRAQLHTYALYARDIWGIDPADIRIFNLYLNGENGAEVVEHPCDAQILQKCEDNIRQDLALMASMLENQDENIPFPVDSHFPMTDDLQTCGRCSFKELCDR